MKIAEIVLNDGEIVSLSSFKETNEFQFRILNEIDFKLLEEYFTKKTILLSAKAKNVLSGGSNGTTINDIKESFTWNKLEEYVLDLETKGALIKRQGINGIMYFPKVKTK